MSIKIILVDDHVMFLEGVQKALSETPDLEVIGVYNNGKKALERIKQKDLDLLITDISMPEINGLELVKQVRQIDASIKILVVSMFKHFQSFNKIDGYLLKETGYNELIMAIKKIVIDGEKYYYKDFQKNHDELDFKKSILTSREKEIVGLIAQQFSVDEIAEKLFLSRHTIEAHKKNIFNKLDVKNAAGLIKKAIYLGYIE